MTDTNKILTLIKYPKNLYEQDGGFIVEKSTNKLMLESQSLDRKSNDNYIFVELETTTAGVWEITHNEKGEKFCKPTWKDEEIISPVARKTKQITVRYPTTEYHVKDGNIVHTGSESIVTCAYKNDFQFVEVADCILMYHTIMNWDCDNTILHNITPTIDIEIMTLTEQDKKDGIVVDEDGCFAEPHKDSN